MNNLVVADIQYISLVHVTIALHQFPALNRLIDSTLDPNPNSSPKPNLKPNLKPKCNPNPIPLTK